MTTVRRFTTDDLFNGGNVNLDHYTENFYLPFYLEYLAKWPEYCSTQESPSGKVIGYVFGKVEGLGERYPWHGHVTAVTVAPEFRRLGMAHALMDLLERVSDEIHAAYFVDLEGERGGSEGSGAEGAAGADSGGAGAARRHQHGHRLSK